MDSWLHRFKKVLIWAVIFVIGLSVITALNIQSARAQTCWATLNGKVEGSNIILSWQTSTLETGYKLQLATTILDETGTEMPGEIIDVTNSSYTTVKPTQTTNYVLWIIDTRILDENGKPVNKRICYSGKLTYDPLLDSFSGGGGGSCDIPAPLLVGKVTKNDDQVTIELGWENQAESAITTNRGQVYRDDSSYAEATIIDNVYFYYKESFPATEKHTYYVKQILPSTTGGPPCESPKSNILTYNPDTGEIEGNTADQDKIDEIFHRVTPKDESCGFVGSWVATRIAEVICAFIQGLAGMTQWIIDTLFTGTFNAYHAGVVKIAQSQFLPLSFIGVAQAQSEESAIRQALLTDKCGSNCWAITSWKSVLALANIGLVIILIFLAAVNILRIQYDTYAIKKALPILIVGIILANFSLLIVRMLVDFANVVTSFFTSGQSAGEFAGCLINPSCASGAAINVSTNPGFGNSLWSLIIWLIFALYVMVAFVILGFLFWIRYAVVLILAIVAPLAFVSMAFPPTQGFFKQWWGWLSKFIFMKPIVFLLLWIASQIIKAPAAGNHITAWLIVATIIYLAIIIPFKLGGWVMGAWGGVGKWATGTGKGGWSRKLAENRLARLKRDTGTWAMRKVPLVGRIVGGAVNKGAASESESKREISRQARLSNARTKGRYSLLRREAQAEEQLTKEQENKFFNQMREGTFQIRGRALLKLTGVKEALGLAKKYLDIEDKLDRSELALKKRVTMDLGNAGQQAMQQHENFMAQTSGFEVARDAEGNALNYADARQELSFQRNEFKVAATPEERERARERIEYLERSIGDFETRTAREHPEVRFEHFLDKNMGGRMQARVNPLIAEDADVIDKSESTKQILDSLRSGGGQAESVFTSQHVSDYLNGRTDLVPITARHGIQAYLMALQRRVTSQSGVDQLEAVSGLNSLIESTSPGASRRLLQEIREQMNPTQRASIEGKLGHSITELTTAEIGHFDMRPQSADRELVRRMAVALRTHYPLGAALSPGKYTGRGRASTIQERIMTRDPRTLQEEYLGGAAALVGATPEERVLRGDPERALNLIFDSGAGQEVQNLEINVTRAVSPAGQQIDDPALRQQISQAISEFEGNNLDALNAHLQQISPDLTVRFTAEELPDIRRAATRAFRGRRNIEVLGQMATVETTVPHYNSNLVNMNAELAAHTREQVDSLATQLQTGIEHGGRVGDDPVVMHAVDDLLTRLGHSRLEREQMAAQLTQGDLPSREMAEGALIDMLRKKIIALNACESLHHEADEELHRRIEDVTASETALGRSQEQIQEAIHNVETAYERNPAYRDPRRIRERIEEIVGVPAAPAPGQPPTPPAAAPPPTTPVAPAAGGEAAPPPAPPTPPAAPAGPAAEPPDTGATEEQPPEPGT